MTIPFNYNAAQALTNPVLIGNYVAQANSSVDTTPQPSQYRLGQITQVGTTVTGVGTTFLATDVGGILTWQDGSTSVITVYTSATQVTVSVTVTKSVAQNFSISKGGNLFVNSALELQTTVAALVVPRMTTTQRLALGTSLANSLSNGSIVYDITLGLTFIYQANAWVKVETTGTGLVIPVGTAAAPGLSFVGDAASGLWQRTAGDVDIAASGANQVEIFGIPNAVNILQLSGSTTGTIPLIVATGVNGTADANITLGLQASGTGGVAIVASSAVTGGSITPGYLTLNNIGNTHSVTIGPTTLSASFSELFASVTITAAQMALIYDTTPFPILAAPGNGLTIIVKSCEFYLNYAATFTGGGNMILEWGNVLHGNGTNVLSAFIPTTFTEATASNLYSLDGQTGGNINGETNQGVFLSNQTGPFAGGAGSTITLFVRYLVVPATI